MPGVLGMLLGVGGAPGVINASLPDSDNTSPGQAEIAFDNDGTYDYIEAGGAASVAWATPSTAVVAAFYELQVNVNSGSIDSGTVDTWLALSSDRGYIKSSVGTAVLRVRIREAATGLVRTDQTVSMVVS